jgi:hypothetical protein
MDTAIAPPEIQIETCPRRGALLVLLAGAGRIDLIGAALVEGQQQGWPAWVFVCLAASIPLLGGFALHQRRLAAGNGSPLVNLALFRHRAGPGEARARGGRLRGAIHHPAGGRRDRGRGHRAVFYSALGRGYPDAFGLGLEVMAGFGLVVAALVQLLRRTT